MVVTPVQISLVVRKVDLQSTIDSSSFVGSNSLRLEIRLI